MTYSWKDRPIEYAQRIDGLWNRWEKIHPGQLYHDITYFEEQEATGRSFAPIWVVTEVVEHPPTSS